MTDPKTGDASALRCLSLEQLIAHATQLLSATTPGPWRWGIQDYDYDEDGRHPDCAASMELNGAEPVLWGCPHCPNIIGGVADREFIAVSPRLVAELLTRLKSAIAGQIAAEERANDPAEIEERRRQRLEGGWEFSGGR